MKRVDYAFPFRIDAAGRQGARAGSYAEHVRNMIRLVLLTSPGERANLPEFGCGLRKLLFAGAGAVASNGEADASGAPSAAAAQLLVRQALAKWLSQHIQVKNVKLDPGGSGPDESRITVTVEYVLIEEREENRLEVTLS